MAKYYLLSDGRKIGIDGSTKSVEDLYKWAQENNIGLSEYYKYETKKGNIINVPRWSVERARALDYPDMQGAVNIADREEKQLAKNLFNRVASGELTVKNPLGKGKDVTRTVAEPDALKVVRYEPPVKKEEPEPSLPMYLQEPLNNFQAVERDIQELSVSRPPDDYPNELAIWKKDWDATVNRAGLYEEQYLSRATGLTKAQREYKEEQKDWAEKYPLLAMLYQLPLGFNSLFDRIASLPHMGNPNADTSHGWGYARSEGMMEGLAEAGQGWSDWGAGFYSLGRYLPMTVATLMAVAAPPTALVTAPVIGLTIPQAVTATTLTLGAASATADEWRKMYMNDGFLSTKEQIAGIMKGVIESATEYLGEAFQVKTFYNAYKLGGRAGLDTAVKQAVTKALYPTLAQYAKAGALMEVSELGEELVSEIGSIVTDNVVLGIPAPGPEEMKQRLRDIVVQTFYGTILQGGALQAVTVSQSAIQARKLNALSDAKLGWSSPKIALDAINQLKALDFTTSRETAIKAAKQLVTEDAAMNPKAKQVVNQAIANVIDATNQYDVLTAQNLYLEEKAVRKEVEELSWRQAQLERGEQTPQTEQRVSDLEYLIEDANTRLETILQKEMENEQQTEILGIMREGNKLEQKARKSNKQALAKLAKTEEYKNATAEEKVAMATKVGQENYKANTLYDKAEAKYKDSALYKLRQTAEYKQAEPEVQAQMEEAELQRQQEARDADIKAAEQRAISEQQEAEKTSQTQPTEAAEDNEVVPDIIDQLEAKKAALRQERQDINKELNEYRKLMDQQGGWLPGVTAEQKQAYHEVKKRQKEVNRKLDEVGIEIRKEKAARKKAEREAQKPKKKVDKKDTKKDTAESEDKDGQKDKERTPGNQRQDTKSDEQQLDDRGESAGTGQADRQGGQDEGGEAGAEEKPKQRKTYVKTKSGGKTRVFEATRIEGEWIYYTNERGTESRTKRNPRTQTTNDPLVYRKWKSEHANRSRGAQRAAQKRDRRLTMSQKVLDSMPNLAALQGRVFPPGEAGDFKNVFIPGYGPLCRESKNDQEWTYDTIYENSIPTPEGAQASRDADYKPILEAAEKELDRWHDGRQTQDTDYWDDAQKAQEEIEYYEKELDKATTEEERQLIRQKLTELDGRVFDDYTEAEQMEMEEAESDGVELNDQGYPASWDEVGTDTRTKSEAARETKPNISDKMADDALLGMVKSHILSTTRDPKTRTTTVRFKNGNELVINHMTEEAMYTEAGKTGIKFAGRTYGKQGKNVYKAIVDLVDGLNTGNRTLFHESFHVVWKLFLNDEQIAYIKQYYRAKANKGELVRKYVVTRQGTEMALYWTKEQFNALNRERQAEALEEGAAYGFEHWLGSRTDTAPTTMIGKLWQRLADAIREIMVSRGLASKNAKLSDIFHRIANDKLTGQGEQGAETRNKEMAALDMMHSRGRSFLDAKMPNRITKDGLKNLISKNLKNDELLSFMLPEFVSQAGEMITKQELMDWLDNNEMKLSVKRLSGNDTQYEKWTLKSGTDYREYLFTTPRLGGYDAPHFTDKNILMHMRLADMDGGLLIEEIQSDYFQALRKQKLKSELPYSKFHEFLLKYAIIEASLKGMDTLYWTTGDTQRERYNMQRPEDDRPRSGWIWQDWYDDNGDPYVFDTRQDAVYQWYEGTSQKDRFEWIDKDAFILYDGGITIDEVFENLYDIDDDFIIDAATGRSNTYLYVDEDGDYVMTYRESEIPAGARAIGLKEDADIEGLVYESNIVYRGDGQGDGEGMSGFYDKIIPEYLDKLGKKYGAKSETHNIKLHKFSIPQAMKDDVLKEGLPRYKPVPTAAEVAEAERQYAEVEAKYKGKTYYRATTPGDTRKIKTDRSDWDQWLFVSQKRESVKYYGDQVSEVTIKPSANTLREGTSQFARIFGSDKKYISAPNKYLDWLADGTNKAKDAGYDVVEFERDSDVGTVILNKDIVGVGDQWLKAPNGKPSNLNERQWVQVRTQAFKDWFGDWENDPKNASKVVDENGEPMVVYHGGTVKNEFYTGAATNKRNQYPFGAHFAIEKELAKWHTEQAANDGKMVSAFLNIRTPLILDYVGRNIALENTKEYNLSKAISSKSKGDELLWQGNIVNEQNGFPKGYSGTGYDVSDVLNTSRGEITIKALREFGYDGALYWARYLNNNNPLTATPTNNTYYRSYIVLSGTQIKSATANVGTFDQSNPDIRYKKLDPILEQVLDDLERERFGRPKPATPSRTATSILPPEEKREERPQPTTTRPPNQNKSQRPGQNKPPTEAEIDALSERIGRDLGIDPAQVKEKLGRQIIAAWREAEGDVSRLMENAAIRNFGEWVEKNKPEGTDKKDLVWHWEEMLEYAAKVGLSREQIAQMVKSDRFDATAIGINLFQRMNYIGKLLVETEATLSDRNWGTPAEREQMEAQYGILQAQFDELQAAYAMQGSEAGTVLWTRRQNKAQYLENLTRAAQALESKINRGAVELGEMRQELDGLERTISDLEKSFEMLLRVMDGKRYKDITEMNDAELEAERQTQAERLNDLRNQAEHLKYAIEQKVAAMQADKGRQEETKTQIRKIRKTGRKAKGSEIKGRKPDVHDWIRALWYNSVLAGAPTHMINMSANVVNSLLEDVATLFTQGGRVAGAQFAEKVRALFSNYEQLDPKTGEKIKTGAFAKAKEEFTGPQEFSKKNEVILKGNKFFMGIQFSTKFLGAEDMLAFFPNERGMLKSLAFDESKRTGRSVADLMENPTADMLRQAYYEAKRNTFNQNPEQYVGVLIDTINKFYGALDQSGGGGKAIGNLIRFNVLPFTRVLGNVLNATIDYTPLGMIRYFAYKSDNPNSLLNRQRKDQNGRPLWLDENGDPMVSPFRMRDARRQAARVALGTILGSLLYFLAMSADDDDDDKWFISGAGPQNYKKYKQLMVAGWRPYSIHIGNAIISYKEWPVSGAFAVVGNLHDIQKYDGKTRPQDWMDKTIYATMGVASSFLDRSFASNAISTATAFDRNDPKWVKRSLTSTTSSTIIPYNNMLRFIENTYNRNLYTPETIAQQAWASVPLVPKKGLPRRVNVFGMYERKDPATARLAMTDNVGLVVPDIKKTREIFKLVRKNNLWLSETNKRELRVDRYVGKRGVAEGDKKYIWLDATDTEKIRVLRGTEYVRLLNEGSNYNRIKKYDKNGDKDKLSALLSKLGKEATAYATEEVLNEYRRNDKMQKKYTTYNKSKEEE